MLKLRIRQPGRDDLVIRLDADEAVIGRHAGCDVTVPQSYVSKRHAKVMAGVVLVDLGSSNGTVVDGQRIDGPVLLAGRPFRLGREASDATVTVEYEPPGNAAPEEILGLREELDAERRRAADLSAQLASLRNEAARPAGDPESLPLVAELRRERDGLLGRLESLKGEIEARDVAASEGLQARLASEALDEARTENAKLRTRIAALEGQAAAPALEAAKKALALRVGELEADLAEKTETVRRLRAELEEARAATAEPDPAALGSELFFKLQADNHKLRKELEEARARPAGEAPELFVSLQEENRRLRERVEALQSEQGAPAQVSAPEAGSPETEELERENHALRMSKADLLAELELLRNKVAARENPASPTPALRDLAQDTPGGGEVTLLLRTLAADDVDDRHRRLDGPLEPFVTFELFRFLRQVERVVTRMAGGFLQLFDQRTLLPDVEGNVRDLLGEVLVSREREPREEFVAYIDELGRWLVVALGANRRAAERFAEELKSELSERSLLEGAPIPGYKKLAGLREAELWQRVSNRLKRLTSDVIEERLQKLTSTCAEEIRREQER